MKLKFITIADRENFRESIIISSLYRWWVDEHEKDVGELVTHCIIDNKDAYYSIPLKAPILFDKINHVFFEFIFNEEKHLDFSRFVDQEALKIATERARNWRKNKEK